MPLYRITLAYDGTNYHGWQEQRQDPTIQGTVRACLDKMAGHPVLLIGAGRTDAGAHAQAQVAHFRLDFHVPPVGILRGLNSMLPSAIRIREADFAAPGFHARYSARSKTYRYYLDLSPVALPFRSRFALHYPHPLRREPMDLAARRFVGRRDFAAFCASSSAARTTVRQCTVSRLLQEGDELVYEISAEGFLQHMVRNIVGTLLEVGRGRLSPEDIDALFDSRDRRLSGPTAPARGLHLVRVDY